MQRSGDWHAAAEHLSQVALSVQAAGVSKQLAENICRAAREIVLEEIDYQMVTVSVGCVIYQNASDFKTLYEADKLMYAAKKQGKNQAVIEYLPSSVQIIQSAK
jgi:PleD family two-component response regulator